MDNEDSPITLRGYKLHYIDAHTFHSRNQHTGKTHGITVRYIKAFWGGESVMQVHNNVQIYNLPAENDNVSAGSEMKICVVTVYDVGEEATREDVVEHVRVYSLVDAWDAIRGHSLTTLMGFGEDVRVGKEIGSPNFSKLSRRARMTGKITLDREEI